MMGTTDVALGIDTGGTYTDAVLIDQVSGRVLAAAKSLTTHHDLSLGIGEAIRAIFKPEALVTECGVESIQPRQVTLVGLSTTLATNAIVEGQGSPICLILIGYDREMIHRYRFEEALVAPYVVYVQGGHTLDGEERAPLDESAVRDAILTHRDRVAAFAVSGYFSVRNPAHELRVKAMIESLTEDSHGLPLPVTCGHELTTRLDAVRRATTVALNAQLIPALRGLILAVRRMLDTEGVHAPLMVVKGDGSLVKADWALQRPIETILSGPAASVVGAWHLAGRKDVWVVDVGGTTTDIAALVDGRPRLNPEGARIDRWRTMVEAVDVHTVGLGGDSHVYLSPDSTGVPYPGASHPIRIGPQRVLPLCRLAQAYPQVLEELRRQRTLKKRPLLQWVGQFLIARRVPEVGLEGWERALVERFKCGPLSLVALAEDAAFRTFLADRVQRLVGRQVALRAAFTPTDALHALGRLDLWDGEAARIGAELLAAQLQMSMGDFCEMVVESVSQRVVTELTRKVLSDEVASLDWGEAPIAAGLLRRALNLVHDTDLLCELRLRLPVVAVGAPVAAYMPRVADYLHTDMVVPPQADVGNAVGAVVGSVVQRVRVLIRPIEFGDKFRAYLPPDLDGQGPFRDFDSVEACVGYAQQVIPPYVRKMAQEAGADQVEVHYVREDRTAPVREKIDDSLYLESVLEFTAVGRPASAK